MIPALTLACLVVLVFLSVVLVVCAILNLGASRWQSRAHTREREATTLERGQLLDRIMHMEGKTWNLPPIDAERPVEVPDYPVLDPGEIPYLHG